MALDGYLTATQNLLQNPTASSPLYNTPTLTQYINTARSQIAVEAECIRLLGTATTTTSMPGLAMSAVTIPPGIGLQQVFKFRMLQYNGHLLYPHPWEWFNYYYYLNQNIPNGPPTDWAQYNEGNDAFAVLSPIPDGAYTLVVDTICLPTYLESDGDPEAIPYPWTDAIPFFAAFYALLSAQSPARQADADKMYQRYELFMKRARTASNMSVSPWQIATVRAAHSKYSNRCINRSQSDLRGERVMLYQYLQKVQRLIWDYKQEIFRPDDLIAFVNTARMRAAAEGEAIRVLASLNTTPNNPTYNFTGITITNTTVQSILNVRMITLNNGGNVTLLTPYSWEWFNTYYVAQNNPTPGIPTYWAQYNQGAFGTFLVSPVPNSAYALQLDCVGLPKPLSVDTDQEGLPYPWTDAVPFYAAYEALLSVQKYDEAAGYYKIYQQYIAQARQFATPSVLPAQNPQNTMVARPSPLGIGQPSVAPSGGALQSGGQQK